MTTKTTKTPATKVESPATQPATKVEAPAKRSSVSVYCVRFDVKAKGPECGGWLVDVCASDRERAVEIAKKNWNRPNHMFHISVRKLPPVITQPRYEYERAKSLEIYNTFGLSELKAEPVNAQPATKVEPATQPATQPAKTPVVTEAKVSMRVVKGSSWDDLKDCPMWVNHKDSKSSVGQFIIEFFSDKDFTGEELAQAFMNQFKTKTGIKPDEKWARRNVKLFVDKGVIMCEIEPEQDAKD